MKRPAFQFYPADWRKDSALQSTSIAARGLWIEMTCIMHECDPYGHLAVNNNPLQEAQLSRLVGEPVNAVKKLLAELESAGVFSRLENGCIYSRRMVKDEHLRNVRAEAGRLGGNPNLLNQNYKQKVNQKEKQNLTPSSSSSSSLKTNPLEQQVALDRFAKFWQSYPKKKNRGTAEKAFAKIKPDDCLLDTILQAIEVEKCSDQWSRDNGQFIPHPASWLNAKGWENAETDNAAKPWEL